MACKKEIEKARKAFEKKKKQVRALYIAKTKRKTVQEIIAEEKTGLEQEEEREHDFEEGIEE